MLGCPHLGSHHAHLGKLITAGHILPEAGRSSLVSVPDLLLLHRKFVSSANTRVTWRTRVASEIIRRNDNG
jgi:hypothetical protein